MWHVTRDWTRVMICDPPEEALPLAGLPAPEQQHVVRCPLLRRGGETQDVVRGVGVQTHLTYSEH